MDPEKDSNSPLQTAILRSSLRIVLVTTQLVAFLQQAGSFSIFESRSGFQNGPVGAQLAHGCRGFLDLSGSVAHELSAFSTEGGKRQPLPMAYEAETWPVFPAAYEAEIRILDHRENPGILDGHRRRHLFHSRR